MATTSRISTIISRLLVSTFSCVKPVAAGAEFLLSGAFIVRPQWLQAWAAATAGISARTERPVITVIQTFQAMTSMPPR
ncbi:hypothetical protein D3C72_1512610 [compost metagenome]